MAKPTGLPAKPTEPVPCAELEVAACPGPEAPVDTTTAESTGMAAAAAVAVTPTTALVPVEFTAIGPSVVPAWPRTEPVTGRPGPARSCASRASTPAPPVA
jgi:hypothetical protein